MPFASESLLTPDLYPAKMDFDRQLISLVPMSRATYKSSSFLDGRTQTASVGHYETPVAQLLEAAAHASAPANPVHYIFHAAFCCSTLLARYLELIPPAFVLKEPLFLTQMAVVRPREIAAHNHGALAPGEWPPLFALCTRLLARGYAAEDVVIVKVNDICNSLGELLLAARPSTKAVFVTIGLREFLLVLLKAPERRQWLRGRLLKARKDAAIIPELAGFDPAAMSDADGGAFLWALNEALRLRLCAVDPSRVLTVPGEDIAESPARPVQAVAAHFGLPVSQGLPKKIFSDETMARHAKQPTIKYDAGTRRKELKELQKRLGKEVDSGVDWATRNRVLFGGRP